MKNLKITAVISAMLSVLTIVSCSTVSNDTNNSSGEQTQAQTGAQIDIDSLSVNIDHSLSEGEVTEIIFDGSVVDVKGDGITVDGRDVIITTAGRYVVSGKLDDGRIVIDATSSDEVQLVLNGVSISVSDSAPIYCKQADRLIITLADGTENYLYDGEVYSFDDESASEPNAAIFSKDDIIIEGEGSLTVNASFNNGIQGKDDVTILSGNVKIVSADDGIVGKDSVVVLGGNVEINSGDDGIKSTNTEETDKGNLVISGGVLDVVSAGDALQSENTILISGGELNIVTGGGSASVVRAPESGFGRFWPEDSTTTLSNDSASIKGLKAQLMISITGGKITVDAEDDAVHSNSALEITGGTLELASGDDGIHADTSIYISGGEICISTCYEGIESTDITIDGGSIELTASDDGINISGGADMSSMGGRPGQNAFAESVGTLTINGGTILVNAAGDGLDSNGDIVMTGGDVTVYGPSDSANGTLDYTTEFAFDGGTLMAAGSSGMHQTPSATSGANSISYVFSSSYSAGSTVSLISKDGQTVMSFTPEKQYSAVIFGGDEITTGETYTVAVNGEAVDEVTVSSAVTTGGSGGGMIGFGGGGRDQMVGGGDGNFFGRK